MILVKNLNFFYSLFLCKLRLKVRFGDFVGRKQAFSDHKKFQFSKVSKNLSHISLGICVPSQGKYILGRTCIPG